VVGDDAQAIYSFRAAAVENILGFADRFKTESRDRILAQNYRSTQQILDSANALMADGARQPSQDLAGTRHPTKSRSTFRWMMRPRRRSTSPARYWRRREIGGSLKRHAILFRSSHHSDVLEVELSKRNIPFVKYGGLKFLEAAHVKDMMSVLRWADNPRNSVAGFRVLKLLPGIGPAIGQTGARSFRGAEFQRQESGRVRCTATGENGLEEILRVAREARRFPRLPGPARWAWYASGTSLSSNAFTTPPGRAWAIWNSWNSCRRSTRAVSGFLTELTLDPPAKSGDQSGGASKDEDYVILSTIHSAKGQEWDIVYVLNVSDGNFPSEFSTGKPEMIEEERRLLYVAMTRARNELHLCAPLRYAVTQQPKDGDAHVYGAKSRFMTDKVLDSCERISLRNMARCGEFAKRRSGNGRRGRATQRKCGECRRRTPSRVRL